MKQDPNRILGLNRMFRPNRLAKPDQPVFKPLAKGGQAVSLDKVSLDNSFNQDGIVTILKAVEGGGVGVQSDGKILLAGEFWDGTYKNSFLMRCTNQGLDTTFGDANGGVRTGMAISHSASPLGQWFSSNIVFQRGSMNEEKIIVAGRVSVAGSVLGAPSHWQFLVARYNPDGILDTTFGDADPTPIDPSRKKGYVVTQFATDTNYASNVAVRTDGRIVVGGWMGDENPDGNPLPEPFYKNRWAVVGFTKDGAIDTSFGVADGNGIRTGIAIVPDFQIEAMAVDSSDRLVLAGEKRLTSDETTGYWTTTVATVVRLTVNGEIDAGFGSNGEASIIIGESGVTGFQGVAVQTILTEQKIVVVGSDDLNNPNNLVVARFNPDGQIDTSFGSDGSGTVIPDFGSGKLLWPSGVAVLSNNEIVAAGVEGSSGTNVVAVALCDPDGKTVSPLTTPIPGNKSAHCWGIASAGADRFVVGGASYPPSDLFVLRYKCK
jgi:uncharacterized delta-60 repeat protein